MVTILSCTRLKVGTILPIAVSGVKPVPANSASRRILSLRSSSYAANSSGLNVTESWNASLTAASNKLLMTSGEVLRTFSARPFLSFFQGWLK